VGLTPQAGEKPTKQHTPKTVQKIKANKQNKLKKQTKTAYLQTIICKYAVFIIKSH